MKIGVLTSSRADFGIYMPLLKRIQKDPDLELEIIAFGTHLSKKHGFTIDEIRGAGFSVNYSLYTIPKGSLSENISYSIGETITIFSKFWADNWFDIVFALGDRFEMFAAVVASSTFNIQIAHIAGGETTLGAIDNSFRHSITHFSKFVFTSTDEYFRRAIEVKGMSIGVFNVGALNIDNLMTLSYYDINTFAELFNIDLKKATVLVTFHPETVGYKKNIDYINELLMVFDELITSYQIVVTMPNSDTEGDMIREVLESYKKRASDSFKLVESFGMLGYLSCMKHCSFMLGNTSSGFVEASFFPKWVINIGDRQKGRLITSNIINTEIKKNKILSAINYIENNKVLNFVNPYGEGKSSELIISIIKNKKNYEVL